MADTIRDIIHNIYYNSSNHLRDSNWRTRLYAHRTNFNRRYMEIPIDIPSFEIPLFAFASFLKIAKINTGNISNIVAELYTTDEICKYKSLDAIMRSVLKDNFRGNSLTKIIIQQDNRDIVYYATCGMVLDKYFNPLLMCSWLLETYTDSKRNVMGYKMVRPLLRISPEVFLLKSNSMERYLANKIPTVCLEDGVPKPYLYEAPIMTGRNHYPVKIEIDDCPFTIRDAGVPSAATTNSELLRLAADHIDELIQ